MVRGVKENTEKGYPCKKRKVIRPNPKRKRAMPIVSAAFLTEELVILLILPDPVKAMLLL